MRSQPLELSGWAYVGRTDTGGVILDRGSGRHHAYYVVDGPDQAPRPLITDAGEVAWLRPDALVLPEQSPIYYGLDGGPPVTDSLVDYLLVPFDGSPPTTLVQDVFIPRALAGARWAAVRNYANEGVGDLTMLDPDGSSLGTIDTDVYPYLSLLAGEGIDPTEPSQTILYQVRDPQHERTGVWSATVEVTHARGEVADCHGTAPPVGPSPPR